MRERILPHKFAIPPQFIIPLSYAELQELGTFSAIWSQIDWLLLLMIREVVRVESIGDIQLMLENLTTGPRVGILNKLCKSDTESIVKCDIRKLCEKNGGLIEDRNHIVHGLWAVEVSKETGLPKAACYFPKSGRKPIYADRLCLISERAAKFCNDLGQLLDKLNPAYKPGMSSAPNPFFFGDCDPHEVPPVSWPPVDGNRWAE